MCDEVVEESKPALICGYYKRVSVQLEFHVFSLFHSFNQKWEGVAVFELQQHVCKHFCKEQRNLQQYQKFNPDIMRRHTREGPHIQMLVRCDSSSYNTKHIYTLSKNNL